MLDFGAINFLMVGLDQKDPWFQSFDDPMSNSFQKPKMNVDVNRLDIQNELAKLQSQKEELKEEIKEDIEKDTKGEMRKDDNPGT